MDPLSDFPALHAVPLDDPMDLLAGGAAVIHLFYGRKFIGIFDSLEPGSGIVTVCTKDSAMPFDLPLANIKIIYFSKRQRCEENAIAAEAVSCGPESTDAVKFCLEFKDGGRFSGQALGYRSCRYGLLFFPTDGLIYKCAFIPYDSIGQCQVDEHVVHTAGKPDVVDGAGALGGGTDDSDADFSRLVGEVTTGAELEYALRYQSSLPDLKLGTILCKDGLITEEQLDAVLQEQARQHTGPLGEMLVERGTLSRSEVQQALAKKLGIPFVNLKKFGIDKAILDIVPGELVKKHQIVPLYLFESKLIVAVENPMDFESLDALRFHTNMNVDSVMTTAADVAWAIDYHYESYGLGSDYMDQLVDSSPLVPEFESATDESSEIEDNIVVKLINKVIVDAHHQGASDIHVEPYKDGKKTIIRFRKDGTLVPYFELPGHYRNALVSRIKIMAGLDISERRKPQDGKIDYCKYGSLDIELRVATMPTVGRIEDIVIRVLSSGKPVPVSELDLSERNHDKIRKAIAKPYGLFLVCGPTGSGKTTTLHSILGDLNTDARKIWTVEDPVEITQEGLRQVQVNPRIGLTFAAAMRSFLRADPDVIMVGEMRDQETLAIGVEASLTGHLVLSTLHTNSAPDSIVRLLDMGMDPFNFADALLGILAQRLAKRLCLECREERIATDDEIQALLREYRKEVKECQNRQLSAEAVMSEWHSKFADRDGRYTLYKAVGCDACDRTGYKGRIGIHEFLDATDVVKRCILDGQTVSELLAAGLEGDMRTLKQDGIEKVLQGYTDMVQVRIVCIK